METLRKSECLRKLDDVDGELKFMPAATSGFLFDL